MPRISATPSRKKPTPKAPRPAKKPLRAERTVTHQDTLIGLLRHPGGSTLPDLMQASGWQAHSVRGFISGTLKKKLALNVVSAPDDDRGRVYRIVDDH